MDIIQWNIILPKKKEKILPLVMWMKLEGIILNESEKDKYCMISLMLNLKKKTLIEKEIRVVVTSCGAGGEEIVGTLSKGTKVQL